MIRTENLRSGYIQDEAEEYIYQMLPERDAVVAEIEDYAAQNRVPIIGPAVARLLTLFVQVSSAKRIFEMGSAIGYSTIWLARAAGPKGKVIYTDGDPEKARRAKDYFRRAGVAKRIDVRVGDALELLKKAPGTFDLIFNDIDKHQYPAARPSSAAADCSSPTTRCGRERLRGRPHRMTFTRRVFRSSTGSSTPRRSSTPF
ncbi:MAG: hypothetical protein DMG45_20300 [Acidobacteria bacterium]|nr:MAG: hypothetical protein DMG45_20300 [Acidobacteriota bacterium]